jgi:nicotinamidase-related amidase
MKITIIITSYYVTHDNKHSALIIIDVQRDIILMGAVAKIQGTLQAVPHIQHLVQLYREKGYPIIHVVRLYRARGRFGTNNLYNLSNHN